MENENLPVNRRRGFAVCRGLEPLTPCVTGTYSNQLDVYKRQAHIPHQIVEQRAAAEEGPGLLPVGEHRSLVHDKYGAPLGRCV